MAWIKAEPNVLKRSETFQQQTGARKQYARERDLSDHEQRLAALPAGAGGAAAASFLQSGIEICARYLPSREKTEK